MTLPLSLRLQNMFGRIAVFILAPIYFAAMRLMGYRVRGLNRIREECALHFRKHEGPWIICANHLTMIDSMIVTYAMSSLIRHVTQYRRVPWNLPERTNFQRNILLTVLCYLSKCIPVRRGGSRDEMKKTLHRCSALLECNHALLIFPEGGRSRTGRVNAESFSYGVGRFVKEFQNCRIMCIYLRGDGQETYGSIPRFGERFTVNIETFRPEPMEYNGLRAQREYAEQIVNRLSSMEEHYFSTHGQRYCGFSRSTQQGEERESAIHRPRFHSR